MTMEELVIAIRVTAESAQEDIEQVTQGIAMIGRAGTQSMAQLRRETAEAISAIEPVSRTCVQKISRFSCFLSVISPPDQRAMMLRSSMETIANTGPPVSSSGEYSSASVIIG